MQGAPSTMATTAVAPRGWSDFVGSPLGQIAAFTALTAVAMLTVAVPQGVDPILWLDVVVLGFLALACTAVLAYRDA